MAVLLFIALALMTLFMASGVLYCVLSIAELRKLGLHVKWAWWPLTIMLAVLTACGVYDCWRAWPWGLDLQREATGAGVPLSAVEDGHPKGPVHRSLRPSPCFSPAMGRGTANPACVACTGAAPGGLWMGGKTNPTAMATTLSPYTRCAYCKRETTATNRYQSEGYLGQGTAECWCCHSRELSGRHRVVLIRKPRRA